MSRQVHWGIVLSSVGVCLLEFYFFNKSKSGLAFRISARHGRLGNRLSHVWTPKDCPSSLPVINKSTEGENEGDFAKRSSLGSTDGTRAVVPGSSASAQSLQSMTVFIFGMFDSAAVAVIVVLVVADGHY